MELTLGVWAQVPAVAHFCDNAKSYRAVLCMNLPTREFIWAVGIGLFVWFLPDAITLGCEAFVFVYTMYRGRRWGNRH